MISLATRIKICGITTPEQAREVAVAGADAIGLVFAKSPRRVTRERATDIIAALPPLVQSVGVFVDPSEQELLDILAQCPLDLIQLHGNESPEFCKRFAPRVIKAFRIKDEADLLALSPYRDTVRGFLLDAWSSRAMGGTGESFDWSIAKKACIQVSTPVILAGGLDPGNAAKAVTQVRPWGVDVSSGVEKSPGIKDMEKVKAFIKAVRSCHEQA